MRALLASTNPHKLAELRRALPGWDVTALALEGRPRPAETGGTFLDNALIKARDGRSHAPPDMWALGEDSGIEAVALGGRPGVESARWAADGVARLLDELAGADDRRARYVCELVAIGPDGSELHSTGVLEGTIAASPRGNQGFGYDPVFVPGGESRTVAELGSGWKERHSHRARAARALVQALAG